MTGEPREDMDIPLSDRLPPVVASRAFTGMSDSALSGSPLPPYRPGMYSGLLPPKPAISELSAALEAEHEVGPPVAEGWPAAWRDDPVPPEAPVAGIADEDVAPEAFDEEAGMLFLDEAEIEPLEAERDPGGYEQAAEDVRMFQPPEEPTAAAKEPAAAAEEPAAAAEEPAVAPEASTMWEPAPEPDTEDVWAWDADETAIYDLAPASAEDTGPWQDSWSDPTSGREPLTEEHDLEPVEPVMELGADLGVAPYEEPAEADGHGHRDFPTEPESAGDVQEWLASGAVESYDWGVEADGEPETEVAFGEPLSSFDEPAATQGAAWEDPGVDAFPEPIAESGAAEWETAEPGEETGELVEMVEQETAFGAALEFSPADGEAGEAPADEAWAPFEPRTAAEQPVGEVEAGPPPGGTPADDERVAIVPPTPIDSWYHGEHGADAEATWAAFGRALEEAAVWGEPGATIATGLPPSETPPAAVETTDEHAVTPVDEDAGPAAAAVSDPAVTDLARRLELLARRLREEGEKGVEHAMNEGDRLEASLAGFIAGYVAARRG